MNDNDRDKHEARVAWWLIGVAALFVVLSVAAYLLWP